MEGTTLTGTTEKAVPMTRKSGPVDVPGTRVESTGRGGRNVCGGEDRKRVPRGGVAMMLTGLRKLGKSRVRNATGQVLTLVAVLALALVIGGCGEASAGDGPHSYVSKGEDSIFHLAWDGDGDGPIQGTLHATGYSEDEHEVSDYEENFVGTAEGETVTIESEGYGTLRGRVEGDRLTIEYEGEEGLEERVYEEAPLEEYEQAAAEFRAEKEEEEPTPITVGYESVEEAATLAELYAQALERKGFEVDREYVDAEDLEGMVERGEVDLLPRYARSPEGSERPSGGLVALEPSNINSQIALTTTREVAEKYGIRDAADLVEHPDLEVLNPWWNHGVNPSGDPLRRLYDLAEERHPDRLWAIDVDDPSGSRNGHYWSLLNGHASAVLGYTTDGHIAEHDLIVLEDDQDLVEEIGNFYPAPFVRTEYLEEHPEVAKILDPLSEQLRIEDLRKMNYANVTYGETDTEEAVRKYLEENPPPEG